MYLEHIEKVNKYRELITDNLIKNGDFPNNKYISEYVSKIDTRLSLINYQTINTENIDVAKLNKDLYYIYSDLIILYNLIYKLSIEKYKELESYCNCYLLSLENVADRCEAKAKAITQNTSLGKVAFFQNSGYDITTTGTTANINIGSITFNDLSIISLDIKGSGFNDSDCILKFGDYSLSPYNINRDTVKLDGKLLTAEYNYELNDDEVITGAFCVDSMSLSPIESNTYTVYSGKDKYYIYSSVQSAIKDKDGAISGLYPSIKNKIRFYLHNATYITFDFITTPTFKNFEGYHIDSPTDMQEFHIEGDSDMMFDFDTDGIIYAAKEDSYVLNDNLYIAGITNATDFLILEQMPLSVQTFDDITLYINNVDYNTFNIDSITIREQDGI